MKKYLHICLTVVIILAVCVFAVACTKNNDNDIKEINVAVPDGAPALAIAKLINNSEFKGYKVNYEIVDGTNIGAKISAGQVDLAIMPTNLGANLFNKGAKIKMVASNVYGLLYLVGTADITSVSDLRGEKILCTGQGGTPDFVLQYVLNTNGITSEDITIEYISQGSDAIAMLNAGTAKFALLGEPAATMAVNKAHAKVLLDLQEEWEKLTGSYGYPQASTFVTDELFTNDVAFLKQFLNAMNENLTWIGENVEAVNKAIKDYNGKTSFASKDVIDRCNLKYVGALESKDAVKTYLEIMASFNPAFIGGSLPNEGFYAGVNLD